jgi:hypothetical protein
VKVGFELEWIGDPPLFAIMRRDNFAIMFRQLKVNGCPSPFVQTGWETSAVGAWDAYVWVKDVDQLYDEFLRNGVPILRKPKDRDIGNRDFEIEDINGYIICFGHSKSRKAIFFTFRLPNATSSSYLPL